MKPVKRETVTLAELRPGDPCLIATDGNVYLVAKVVETRATENVLLYIPGVFTAVGVPEFVPTDDGVCTCSFPPGQRFERLELEAGAQ